MSWTRTRRKVLLITTVYVAFLLIAAVLAAADGGDRRDDNDDRQDRNRDRRDQRKHRGKDGNDGRGPRKGTHGPVSAPVVPSIPPPPIPTVTPPSPPPPIPTVTPPSPPPPSPTVTLPSPPPPSPTVTLPSPPPPSPAISPPSTPPPSPSASPPSPSPTVISPSPPPRSPPPVIPPVSAPSPNDPVSFYPSACPSARSLVGSTVQLAIQGDQGLPAALLRMQFHDCFVRGCDASILLDSNQTNLAEKDGVGNAFSVRGYEVIDAVKTAVESVCPGIVSCADIIALATRDAIALIGGPSWKVVSGRGDGLVSRASETPSNLPPPNADYSFLVNRFTRKGMTEKDMVVLSGAHTIGVTHCGMIEGRLYNSSGPNGMDPTLDASYAAELKQQCPFGQNDMTEVKLDPTNGGNAFDRTYYTNVQNKRVLFNSDANLITTASGSSIVAAEAAGPTLPFFADFAASMEKLINLQTLQAPAGEIRRKCGFTN